VVLKGLGLFVYWLLGLWPCFFYVEPIMSEGYSHFSKAFMLGSCMVSTGFGVAYEFYHRSGVSSYTITFILPQCHL
jgi:hypothetical protein